MNFNGMLEEAFDRELAEFKIDEKLGLRLERAERQAAAFLSRFPLRRLTALSQREFVREDGSADDFCHWITDETRDVAQTCSWDKIRFFGYGSRRKFEGPWAGNNGRKIPLMRSDEEFKDRVVRPLVRILDINGRADVPRICRDGAFRWEFDRAAAIFGRPLLLKLFLLYHPDAFINITRIEWLERTAVAFGFQQGGWSALETNWFVRRFYEGKSKKVRQLPPLAFVEVLDRCLGFSTRGEEDFRSYLADTRGYSAAAVAAHCRMLREMTRYAVGRRISPRALQRVDDPEMLRMIGKSMWDDAEWRRHCEYDAKGYAHTLELLLEFCRFRFHAVPKTTPVERREKTTHKPKIKDLDQTAAMLARLKKSATVGELAVALCDLAKTHPSYSHYTTLSSLLSIVNSLDGHAALRLTRGDDPGMNDQLESLSCGEESIWRRTFIISFSSTAHENVAMWGLYCKPANEAVRLTFPRQMTVDWINDVREGRCCIKAEVERCPGDKHPQLADIPVGCADVFLGDVLYDADVLAQGVGKDRYRIGKTNLSRGDFKCLKNDLFHREDEMTGFVKSIDWFYEEEVRIIVRLKDTLRVGGLIESAQDLLKIKHLYLQLPDGFLSSIEYRLGPCIPEKLREMFEKKIIAETKVNQVLTSAYYGKLKLRV